VTCYEIKSFLNEVTDSFCKTIIEGQAISIAQVHGDEVQHEIIVKKKKPDEIALRACERITSQFAGQRV
jgi:hypothetical protein